MVRLGFTGCVDNNTTNELFKPFLAFLPVFWFVGRFRKTANLGASLDISVVTLEANAKYPAIQSPYITKHLTRQCRRSVSLDLSRNFKEICINWWRHTIA